MQLEDMNELINSIGQDGTDTELSEENRTDYMKRNFNEHLKSILKIVRK